MAIKKSAGVPRLFANVLFEPSLFGKRANRNMRFKANGGRKLFKKGVSRPYY
jgi:hypothetical protein